MKLHIIGVTVLVSPCFSFVLDSVMMDEATFAACSTCDARADRAANAVIANALRDYFTQNHIKLLINSNDGVQVTKSLPNQKINTGHSCSKTAEARGVTVNAKMTKKSAALDSLEMEYDDFVQNAFITGDVPHQVKVNADIRVRFGSKILFGKCKTYARKTCRVTASSTGMNHLSVNLAASDHSITTLPDGMNILQFKLNVDFEGKPKPETYTRFSSGSSCSILGGLVTMNSLVQKYAGRYVNGNDAINKIRGPDLLNRLETLLKARFGDTVTVPIKIKSPSLKARKKRAVQIGCQRMQCPFGFSRLGNSKKCQKLFRTSKPNCAAYGNVATLYQRKFGSRTYYWCHVNMILQ